MSAKLEVVPIGDIDVNPFRRVNDYPYVDSKIEILMRSIAEVGMWEGVIGRRKGNRIEIAFGHHRVEAARRLKLSTVSIFVRDLSEEQMLMFMGRENSEDYNADFNCMLETWESAIGFLGGQPGRMKIASLLGWTRLHANRGEIPNEVADTCDLAHDLIVANHYARKDFAYLSVKAVREIVQVQTARLNRVDRTGAAFKWDESKIKRAKEAVTVSGKNTAKEVRAGNIATKDIRSKADEFFIQQKAVRKEPALLAMAIQPMMRKIDNTFRDDPEGKKLTELARALPGVVADLTGEDKRALDGLVLALSHVGQRIEVHTRQLDYKKVVAIGPAAKRLTAVKKGA
jgi:hypothetical protein